LGGSQFQTILGKKVFETPFQWKKAAHGGMPVILAVSRKHKIGLHCRLNWAKISTQVPK
jgi:hypothetical protein